MYPILLSPSNPFKGHCYLHFPTKDKTTSTNVCVGPSAVPGVQVGGGGSFFFFLGGGGGLWVVNF